MKQICLAALILAILFGYDAYAQTRVNVRFARGTSSATVRGSVNGYKYVDYRVYARGGQTMWVKITTPSPYASFVVFDGQMQNVDGATEETDWSGTLPSDGNYTIRVLLPRSAARRRTSASYLLKISIH